MLLLRLIFTAELENNVFCQTKFNLLWQSVGMSSNMLTSLNLFAIIILARTKYVLLIL